VERLPSLSRPNVTLWVKRDDRTSDVYGGNKVRKLERLLGDALARRRGASSRSGPRGATTCSRQRSWAREQGIELDAVLVPHATPTSWRICAPIVRRRRSRASRIVVRPCCAAGPRAHRAWRLSHSRGRLESARHTGLRRRRARACGAGARGRTARAGRRRGGPGIGWNRGRARGWVRARENEDPHRSGHRVGARPGGSPAGCARSQEPPSSTRRDARREACRRHGSSSIRDTWARDMVTRRQRESAHSRSARIAGLTLDLTYTAKTFAATLDRVDARAATRTCFIGTRSRAHPWTAGSKGPRQRRPSPPSFAGFSCQVDNVSRSFFFCHSERSFGPHCDMGSFSRWAASG
jgi:hypothetical protein